MENIFYTSDNYEDLLLEVLKFSNDKNAVVISTDEIYDCIQKKQSASLFDIFKTDKTIVITVLDETDLFVQILLITLLKGRNSETYIFSDSGIDSVISNSALKAYLKRNYRFETIASMSKKSGNYLYKEDYV